MQVRRVITPTVRFDQGVVRRTASPAVREMEPDDVTRATEVDPVLVVKRADGRAEVTIDGVMKVLEASESAETQQTITAMVTERAAALGCPVKMITRSDDGDTAVVVFPSGAVWPGSVDEAASPETTTVIPPTPLKTIIRAQPRRPARSRGSEAAAPIAVMADERPLAVTSTVSSTATGPADEPSVPARAATSPAVPAQPEVTVRVPGRSAPATGADFTTPAGTEVSIGDDVSPTPPLYTAPIVHEDATPAARPSFVRHHHTETIAAEGWRGALNGLGMRLAPSEDELSSRADMQTVSQHWMGPRTIAVVNAKGGSGKTPTTAMLAATFARYGGAGVLAWENNQTRGTLGWRTEQADHQATSMDLLPRVEQMLSSEARVADLAQYVHHQRTDRYDVLCSQPLVLASEQRVTSRDVDAVHDLASRFYRMIFIDSGNDESDPAWLRMIDHANQIVVPTTTRDDHAEAGALLLEALAARDERSALLAANAVVVVSRADPKASAADVQRVVDGFSALAREVVVVPFDATLVDGQLQYDAQQPATRRAWLSASAAVARGL